MKKALKWPIASIFSLLSLIALLIFDFILSVIYYFLEKVPFLTDIIDFIGEVLDLGLTAFAALFLVATIFDWGNALIGKLCGNSFNSSNSPIHHTNNLFLFVFLAALIFIVIKFAFIVGGVVSSYSAAADTEGLTAVLVFFTAVKDAFVFVCEQNIIIYKIGANSLLLYIANISLSLLGHDS